MTGVTFYSAVLAGKALDQMHALVPTAGAIGYLTNLDNPGNVVGIRDVETAARALGLQVHVLNASSEGEIDAAFATLHERNVGALVVSGDPLFFSYPVKLVELAARYAIPASYFERVFVEAGGLMSYGSRQNDAYRDAGIYAGKILQGAKPADLPVQFPTKFELVINLKTAKALGVTISRDMLLIADGVIE